MAAIRTLSPHVGESRREGFDRGGSMSPRANLLAIARPPLPTLSRKGRGL